MISESQADELLLVFNRIARALETISSVIDRDESEFNVYVRGDISLTDSDDDDDEEEDLEEEYEEEREQDLVH